MLKIFKILLLATIIISPVQTSALMESPSYRIDYERISSGGGVEGSDGYNMLETLGEFGAGAGASDNYQVGAGEAYGIMADVTPAPTLLDNGSYNSLNFRINRGREYEDDPAMVLHLKFNQDPVFDYYTTTGVASEEVNTTSTTKIAQKFQTGTSTDFIGSIDIYQTAGDDLVGNFTIETDNAGQPSGATVGDGATGITLNAGSATHVKLASSTQVVSNNIYWLIFAPSSGSGSFQGNTSGETDRVKVYDGDSWDLSSTTESIYFRVFDRADDSRDNNHGQILGALTAGGRYGRGLDFDGTDDYVEVADDDSLDLTNSFTLSAWVKTDSSASEQKVLEKGPYTTGNYYLSILGSGNSDVLRFNSDELTACDGSTAVRDDNWHHVAATFDGSNIKVYTNGELENICASPGAITSATYTLTIGSRTGTAMFFNGTIDEVAIYDRVLSANEIARHAQIANPSDAEYAIGISDDSWATTRYIQTDNTIGSTMVWQTYANWGEGTGEIATGLESDATYRIKVKSRQGQFTETPWSLDTSAKTSLVSLSFNISANSCDFGSLTPNQVSECTTILNIDTNADSGYQTTIIENHDMRDADNNIISDVSDGAVDRGEEYGIRTSGSSDGQMSSQDYAITLSPQVVASNSGPALARQTIVTYKIVTTPSTLAGLYAHTVIYVTTATY